MFSFLSEVKAKRFLYAAFIVLAIVFLFAGCDSDSDPVLPPAVYSTMIPDNLLGKWVSTYGDWYEITRVNDVETLKYFMPGAEFGGVFYPDWEYEGRICAVIAFNEETGVIIIKYPDDDDPAPYQAHYYLDFIPGVSVSINSTGDANTLADLEEAKEKFNFDDMADYIDLAWKTNYFKE